MTDDTPIANDGLDAPPSSAELTAEDIGKLEAADREVLGEEAVGETDAGREVPKYKTKAHVEAAKLMYGDSYDKLVARGAIVVPEGEEESPRRRGQRGVRTARHSKSAKKARTPRAARKRAKKASEQ